MDPVALAIIAAFGLGAWAFGTSSSGAARLSDDEVAELLHRIGWQGDDLETAIRIVLGESRANPSARNVNRNGTVDRGLFQLNSKSFADIADSAAFDPVKNAVRAFKAYRKQGGFRPGASAWWGPTKFHTLRRDRSSGAMVADVELVRRARAARERLEARRGMA